jgi:hypothetical protein
MIEYLNNSRMIHAALEAWPVSSSWHMEHFFSLGEEVIKSWHVDLLPAYALIALFTVYKKNFFCLKTLLYALAPCVLLYLIMKFSFIDSIEFSSQATHLIAAAILITVSFFVETEAAGEAPNDFKRLLVVVGVFQSLALFFPGISRLVCCLLALTVQRSSLFDVVLASFTLQFVQVLGWALLFQETLISPDITMSFYALEQVIFLAGLGLFILFSRFSLIAIAFYRIGWLWILM